MFDFSHLPQNAALAEFIFNRADASTPTRPMVWYKPPNCRLVFMLTIGGGGGGAGGVAGAAGTSRNGGGGGGSGGVSQALFLAHVIPSSLYVFPYAPATSRSCIGGASNSSGSGGPHIAIANYATGGSASPNSFPVFLSSYGGDGGTTSSQGTGGSIISTEAFLANHAIYWRTIGGRAGTFATNGLPANTSIGTASPILGGAGGGGVLAGAPTVFNGAGFTSEIPAILPDIAGGIASSALDASSGVRLPFLSVGGAGGGGNNNGPGGRGGNGAGYGTGGGGGGAGVTGQGGRGGDGGPAYACIIAW